MKPVTRLRARRRDPALFGVVFEGRPTASAAIPRHLGAWGLALALHAVLFALATPSAPSLEPWSMRMAASIRAELSQQAPMAVDLTPVPEQEAAAPEPPPAELPPPAEPPDKPVAEVTKPEPPPPVPAPPAEAKAETTPEPKAKRRKARPRPKAVDPEDPAPAGPKTPGQAATAPAAAGRIVAADPNAAPLDFTDEPFAVGGAETFGGGAPTSGGTGTKPGVGGGGTGQGGDGTDETDEDGTKPAAPATSRARGVSLSGREWRCAWPKTAMDRDIYEQFVVLRVVVKADGRVEKATLVKDPGDGFGAAALACARRTRFPAARNDAGDPIRATSPPIRVRFTR